MMERLEMKMRFARTRIAFRIRARLTLMLDGMAERVDPLSPTAFMLDEDAFSWEDDDWDVPGNPDYGFPREEGDYRWYLGDN